MLPNILRSKGNQTMNFGQLIEFNMRNIFLEKSYTKWSGETIPRSFSKNLDPGPGPWTLDPGSGP